MVPFGLTTRPSCQVTAALILQRGSPKRYPGTGPVPGNRISCRFHSVPRSHLLPRDFVTPGEVFGRQKTGRIVWNVHAIIIWSRLISKISWISLDCQRQHPRNLRKDCAMQMLVLQGQSWDEYQLIVISGSSHTNSQGVRGHLSWKAIP